MTISASAPVALSVSDDNVWAIVEQVWESLLQAPAERAVDLLDDAAPDQLMTAVVHLDGAWTGAVHVTCSATSAESMARAMLLLADDEDATREDVEDALGEVVNVIGGNVKALVEPPTTLSLPSVTRGTVPSGGRIVRRVGSLWNGSTVEVVVTEHADPVHATLTNRIN